MKSTKGGNGKVGIVGFCYGGGVCNAAAVAYLELACAGLDERINAGWSNYEAALKAAGTDYEAFVYEGVNHGFHNDPTPRHDEAAAEQAYARTVELFETKLS